MNNFRAIRMQSKIKAVKKNTNPFPLAERDETILVKLKRLYKMSEDG
jgi:hypothetical protein